MKFPAGEGAVSRGLGWVCVAVLFAAIALAGQGVSNEAIDWQPALAIDQPWRAFTAIGVHYSAMHLYANLGGLLLTAALGVVARVPTGIAIAWLVAWPLTQFGLTIEPSLAHYGGLSGVLHAGVAAVIVYLLARGTRAQKWVAGAALLGLVAKIAHEAPWGPATRQVEGWDIAIAPLVHATGAVAGAVCALVAMRIEEQRRKPTR